MSADAQFAPAALWRAFFVFILLGGTALLPAAPAPKPPELAQVGKPDEAEAARLIGLVREAGIPGEFYFTFELRSIPRRGEGPTFKGQLWAGRTEKGVVTRIELVDGGGATHRLLLFKGERAPVWKLVDGRPMELDAASVLKPLIPGVEVSAFDLQMPFLYWPDAHVEKITRVLGRPTNAFMFRAPKAFIEKHPEISGVRAYLDTQFNAIMQTELLGANGRPTKTFAFVSLKRVSDQHIPKQADYRNEVTRDKTRLQITGAALNLDLPSSLFDPANLAKPAAPPPAAKIVRVD